MNTDAFTDEALNADLAYTASGGAAGPGNRAKHLLRLDTPARRLRASMEAHTLGNLRPGGRPSDDVRVAVENLLHLIGIDRESEEMYGERTAREYRELDDAALPTHYDKALRSAFHR